MENKRYYLSLFLIRYINSMPINVLLDMKFKDYSQVLVHYWLIMFI